MFDYTAFNQTAAQNQDIISKLNEIYALAMKSYPPLSRFSIALIGNNTVSNYYVRDKLADIGRYDYLEQELRENSSLTSIAFTANIRIVDCLHDMLQTERIKELIKLGHSSSYTFPISYQGKTIGFIFFNASEDGFFSLSDSQRDFAYLSQLIAGLFVQLYENQKHFQSTLAVALNMGHARDPETQEHLTRMGMYSELIARLLSETVAEVTHPFIHRIRLYAPFHDIGKYMIPDEILYSNRRYTPQEREIMNRHTVYGEGIIDDVISLSSVNSVSGEEIAFIKNIVRHHHEHFNGKGLPDGLKGESIPLEARIVTLADVFDALLSKRAYKPAWSVEQVVEYIEENEGVIFDPQCVRVLVSNLELFLDIRATYVDRAEAVDAIAS